MPCFVIAAFLVISAFLVIIDFHSLMPSEALFDETTLICIFANQSRLLNLCSHWICEVQSRLYH